MGAGIPVHPALVDQLKVVGTVLQQAPCQYPLPICLGQVGEALQHLPVNVPVSPDNGDVVIAYPINSVVARLPEAVDALTGVDP